MTQAVAWRMAAWWADDIRPDQVVKVIQDAFPEVRTVYFGNATRRWWALYGRQGVDERWLEADTPQRLCEMIIECVPRPLRRMPRHDAPRPTGGTSTFRPSEQAMPPRFGPAPVPRADGVHAAQSLFPPPSRLRRVLDGCRRAVRRLVLEAPPAR